MTTREVVLRPRDSRDRVAAPATPPELLITDKDGYHWPLRAELCSQGTLGLRVGGLDQDNLPMRSDEELQCCHDKNRQLALDAYEHNCDMLQLLKNNELGAKRDISMAPDHLTTVPASSL